VRCLMSETVESRVGKTRREEHSGTLGMSIAPESLRSARQRSENANTVDGDCGMHGMSTSEGAAMSGYTGYVAARDARQVVTTCGLQREQQEEWQKGARQPRAARTDQPARGRVTESIPVTRANRLAVW